MSDEPVYAVGRVIEITEIKCFGCRNEFDEIGNLDGQTIVCPHCGLKITIRKDDGA